MRRTLSATLRTKDACCSSAEQHDAFLEQGHKCSIHAHACMGKELLPLAANPQKLTLKILRIDYRTQHLLDNDYRTHNVHCLLRSTAYMSYYACVVHLMLCDECTPQLLLGNLLRVATACYALYARNTTCFALRSALHNVYCSYNAPHYMFLHCMPQGLVALPCLTHHTTCVCNACMPQHIPCVHAPLGALRACSLGRTHGAGALCSNLQRFW